MARQSLWDEFEAAILLDACIQTEAGELSKKEAIREVSETLRHRAVVCGKKIDDVFRNVNGITMQYSIMDCILMGRKVIPHDGSALFYDTVALYKEDREEFNKLVRTAKRQCVYGMEYELEQEAEDEPDFD